MMKIAIGSKNKAKVEAVKSVFLEGQYLFETYNVPSGVSAQPFSDDETIEGAINRAKNCLIESDADVAIGLEGGVHEGRYGLMLCNWGALVKRDGSPIIAGGARLLLPENIARELRQGRELGVVIDEYCQKENIRDYEGTFGIFTNGKITRKEMFEHVVKALKGQMEYYIS